MAIIGVLTVMIWKQSLFEGCIEFSTGSFCQGEDFVAPLYTPKIE